MTNSEVPVFSARNCSASRTIRGLSRSDQPASAPSARARSTAMIGATSSGSIRASRREGRKPSSPAASQDHVVAGAGRLPRDLPRDRGRLQVRGVSARPLVCGDQVGEQVAVERVVDGVRLQRRVAGERRGPGRGRRATPAPGPPHKRRRRRRTGRRLRSSPANARGREGARIALPRCARSALRAGAVTLLRSQARSPVPSGAEQLVDQRGGVGAGGDLPARREVGDDRRGADALVRHPGAPGLGRASVVTRPSTSTGRPCSSRPGSARLCSATSSHASLSTGDPDEPGSVSVTYVRYGRRPPRPGGCCGPRSRGRGRRDAGRCSPGAR